MLLRKFVKLYQMDLWRLNTSCLIFFVLFMFYQYCGNVEHKFQLLIVFFKCDWSRKYIYFSTGNPKVNGIVIPWAKLEKTIIANEWNKPGWRFIRHWTCSELYSHSATDAYYASFILYANTIQVSFESWRDWNDMKCIICHNNLPWTGVYSCWSALEVLLWFWVERLLSSCKKRHVFLKYYQTNLTK